jgi:hypothetical protein
MNAHPIMQIPYGLRNRVVGIDRDALLVAAVRAADPAAVAQEQRYAARGPSNVIRGECGYLDTAGRQVFTLRSLASWKYVSVEYDYTGWPGSDTAGVWERFYVHVPSD